MKAIVAAISLLATCAAFAQPYPSRPVRLMIPAAPGGNPDVMARLLTPRLQSALGQPRSEEHTSELQSH